MGKAYCISAKELAARGRNALPPELASSEHLIYSSPATLAFNSPGAQGFGVKRAGLAVPGSVMLLVSPGCCGRNTATLSELGYSERFFYLLMDETDIVTGRHLRKIPQAVQEVCGACETPPTVIMLCITCVDALLGTDMDRVCRRAAEAAGVPVLPCYMYALTREGRLPPMAAVRQTVYALLEPREKKANEINILGFFAPLQDDCELYALLERAGISKVREISRCERFEDYLCMAQANFNLVLNPEARFAAADLEKRLGIPSVELTRMYQLDKIQTQYRLFGQAIGVTFDDEAYCREAQEAVDTLRSRYGSARFSVGEMLNGDPFELALALLRYGFVVPEIFGTVSTFNFSFLRKIAQLSPGTKIYSNLAPTMLHYDIADSVCDLTLGRDAGYYHPGCRHVDWCEETQPFGYRGVTALFRRLSSALGGETP